MLSYHQITKINFVWFFLQIVVTNTVPHETQKMQCSKIRIFVLCSYCLFIFLNIFWCFICRLSSPTQCPTRRRKCNAARFEPSTWASCCLKPFAVFTTRNPCHTCLNTSRPMIKYGSPSLPMLSFSHVFWPAKNFKNLAHTRPMINVEYLPIPSSPYPLPQKCSDYFQSWLLLSPFTDDVSMWNSTLLLLSCIS